jgi:hypothetical protein
MRIGPFVIPSMYMVHGAAVIVGITLVITLLRGALIGETVSACSTRFNNGTIYGLETSTGLISTSDLQAGLAGRDFGVMENLEIVRLTGGPAKSGLRVRLASIESKTTTDAGVDNGVDFGWTPKRMPNVKVGCLSYSVKVPAGFRMGEGGRLPSLVGAPKDIAGDNRSIGALLMWTNTGVLSMDIKAEAPDDGTLTSTVVHGEFALPVGTWVRIDQEAILNTPGKDDGEIRVWVDGVLKLRRDGLVIRRDEKTFFNSVAVTVAYNAAQGQLADGTAAIEVSPFEIRWP